MSTKPKSVVVTPAIRIHVDSARLFVSTVRSLGGRAIEIERTEAYVVFRVEAA